MPTEDAFIKDSIQGILIAVSFSFVILLISTRNLIISLIAIYNIAIIIASIIATLVLND